MQKLLNFFRKKFLSYKNVEFSPKNLYLLSDIGSFTSLGSFFKKTSREFQSVPIRTIDPKSTHLSALVVMWWTRPSVFQVFIDPNDSKSRSYKSTRQEKCKQSDKCAKRSRNTEAIADMLTVFLKMNIRKTVRIG